MDAAVASDASPAVDARVAADAGSACAEGCECAQSCDERACRCTEGCGCALSCDPGGDCRDVVCDGAGTTCAFAASGAAKVAIRCDHHSVCTIDARDAHDATGLDCKNDASCEVDCAGADACHVHCEGMSPCTLACAGSPDCTIDCAGSTAIDCGDGVLACHRACP